MKKIFIKLNLILFTFIIISASTNAILASSDVPFEYNILPTITKNSIIDTKAQKKLKFKLYENTEAIYYQEKIIKVNDDNTFDIQINKLSGKQDIIFRNDDNETVSFTYYFSDKKGNVNDYELVEGQKLSTIVTTYKDIQIIYSSKEKAGAKKLISYLKKLPNQVLKNVEKITMIPFENESNIAGVTLDNSITLYKFSKYSTATQKNIIYHEITHTWATKLMQYKIIDYSYSDYQKVVQEDNNFVSTYSKSYIEGKESYNEDFAECVSFFFINKHNFKKKYPNRYEYINTLTNIKFEEKESD